MVTTDRIAGLNSSVAFKPACKVATIANITLSGEQTIDVVSVTDGDRVLVKDQTDSSENGIYVCSTGTWSRSQDFDGERDVVQYSLAYAGAGSSQNAAVYVLETEDPTIGTDDLTFSQVFDASTLTGLIAATITGATKGDFLFWTGAAWVNKQFAASEGTSIASATTTDIGAADSDFVQITGTTTIESLGATTDRDWVWVKFAGALTLTHNATSLILPSGANITTAAGDTAVFVRISGSNWQCLNYSRVGGLESGTQGDVLYYGANGVPAKLTAGTSGQFLTTGGAAANPSWTTQTHAIPNNGYKTDQYYFGVGFANPNTTTNAAATADRLYGKVFVVGDTETFTRIGLYIQTLSTGAARLGIYNFADGVPTDLVADLGTIDVTSTGAKEVTISQALDPGVYVLAVVFQATPTYVCWPGTGKEGLFIAHFTGYGASSNQNDYFGFYVAHSYGALPDPFGTPDGAMSVDVPNIWLRKV